VPELLPIAVFVKLEYWDAYRAAVVLAVRCLGKILIIFGIIGGLWLVLLVFAALKPAPERDWYETVRQTNLLVWPLVAVVLFVFVLPFLSAGRVASEERFKRGIRYRISGAGVHVESYVSTSDLQWGAFRHAIEIRSAFLLFTSPSLVQVLPRRCFASETDIAVVRDLLRVHIPKAKLRRG
jgi:hypothetical protein